MDFKKKNSSLLVEAKNKELKIIVNSIFNQTLDHSLNIKVNELLKSFHIDEKNKKTILITYCLLQKNIDCALFGTTNMEHLNLIGKGYEKYKVNFSELFTQLENIF